MNVAEPEKISALVHDGWDLLSRGDAEAATLAFSRVLLVESEHAEARRGLEASRASAAEARRRLDEQLEEARLAVEAGDRVGARAILLALLATSGADRERVATLLDRTDEREGRLEGGARRVAGDAEARPASGGRWSRRVFAATCASVLALLGAGVAATWDGFLAGLARAPSAESADLHLVVPAPVPGDDERALAEARRLLERGDPAGALQALDAVNPEHPSYPLARQLRQQAEQAAGRTPTAPTDGARTIGTSPLP